MNYCGCCEGIGVETPVRVQNRAGLSAIAYRVGTHSRFKESMLARLATLPGLQTRAGDDFSIAILDAWATVADVLTFYQERIANESYLRTSTERDSLVQLARLIGYRLRPGVAASAYLSFTIEGAPGSTGTAIIDVGTKVQSIPGPKEDPQTFETVERISANARWNAMKPRLTTPQPISAGMSVLLLKGVTTKLAKGDALLIIAPDGSGNVDRKLRRVAAVNEDNSAQQTTVTLVSLAPSRPILMFPGHFLPGEFVLGKVPFNTTTIQNQVLDQSWNSFDLDAFARAQGFSINQMYQVISRGYRQGSPAPDTSVMAMRKRATLFGYNAPDWNAMSNSTRGHYGGGNGDWPLPSFNTSSTLYLDQVYKEIKPNDWVVVSRPGKSDVIAQVTSVDETAASYFAISAQVMAITLGGGADVSLASMGELRQTSVYIVPEELAPDDLPDTSDVQSTPIRLDGPVQGLAPGQTIVISGLRSDAEGVTDAEAAFISNVTLDGGYTTLELLNNLQHPYIRLSVMINGNVARATHGEATRETLGAGDASQMYQQFVLKQSPLTYVPSANESGATSTLQVFVNDVQWHEEDDLLDAGPRDRVFVTRTGDDGKTTLEFGDGKTGARVPTGRENVRAVYRKGIGKGGNVDAGRLSLLMSRPLGVKDVTNSVAATGGDNPEAIEQARGNAPVAVLTLGRIVSLRDYEDFARAFAGIAKALATWTWDGQTHGVFVTLAGPDGAAVSDDSLTYKNLLTSMQNEGDPFVPLRLKTYIPAYFQVSAKIKLDADYAANSDKVLAAVDATLRAAYSFDARQFGEPVQLSRVIALMQAVAGVVAVDVDALYRTGETVSSTPPARLLAAFPKAGADGSSTAAELLMLDPRPVNLSVMK
jgi:hypothetical protein